MKKSINNPSGLEKNDTLKDALSRADELSRPDGSAYSGMMLDRKDLRRIVLLTREYRKLLDKKPDPAIKEAVGLIKGAKASLESARSLGLKMTALDIMGEVAHKLETALIILRENN